MARLSVNRFVNASLILLLSVSNLVLTPAARAAGEPTVVIGSQSAVNGATINVPVNASDLGSVSGVTLAGIQFDSTLLTYTGATLNALPAGATVNLVGSQINVNWFDGTNASPITLNSATLLTLHFTVISAASTTATLAFAGTKEVVDQSGNPISATFTNGTVAFNEVDPNIADVAADKAALTEAAIKGGNADLQNVTGPLASLPLTGVQGSVIAWASSNAAVVSSDGQTVVRPLFSAGNTALTLTATLTKGSVADTKTFSLTVLKLPASSVATVTSHIYTVTDISTSTGMIAAIPFGTSKTAFLSTITKGESHQAFQTTSISDPVLSGNTLLVFAEDGATMMTYTLIVLPSSAKAITAFSLNEPPTAGVINEVSRTIAVTVPFGTNVTALTPAIMLSSGASVSPASGVAQNFTNPVVYTVTAADNSTAVYTVTVTVAPNTAKDIIALSFANPQATGIIAGESITVPKIPFGTNVTSLVPTISISGASVSPASGIAQNFTNPVLYTVTAADGSTKTYTVSLVVNPAPPVISFIAGDNIVNASEKRAIHILGTSEGYTTVSVTLSDGTNTIRKTQLLLSDQSSFDIVFDAASSLPSPLADGTITVAAYATNAYDGASPAVNKTALLDTNFPTVTKLGNGSVDVVLPAGNTDLVFSEVLSTQSQSDVLKAIVIGAKKTVSTSWVGATLRIQASENVTFENDVVAKLSDAAGNVSLSLILIDSALGNTQAAPDETGKALVDSAKPHVVITDPTSAATITVASGVNNATIDLSSFVSQGSGIVPQITIAASNAANASVAIPAGATIASADPSWNGVIAAPTLTTVELTLEPGQTKTLSMAIKVGSDSTLTFTKAVRIVLPGQAGKRAGFVSAGGTALSEIKNRCSEDTQAAADSLGGGSECLMDSGSNLVIWTKHFTTFASFSQAAIPSAVVILGGSVQFAPSFTAPLEGISVSINNNAESTNSREVMLRLNGGGDAVRMAISHTPDFSTSSPEDYASSRQWFLLPGDGIKTVYAKFYNSAGSPSGVVSASIRLDTAIRVYRIQDAPHKTVLGVKIYPEGTLIRGSNHKIYAVRGGKLKHILNLRELGKFYFGKEIVNVRDKVIAGYDFTMDMRRKKALPQKSSVNSTST